MTKLTKQIVTGIIITIPVALLTIRLVFNFVITGAIQLVYKALGRYNTVYWTVGNEWVQYQMDLEDWTDLWKGRK